MKEAIITVVLSSDEFGMSDEQGVPFPITQMYRVEFEGAVQEVISAEGDHIFTLTKVIGYERLGAITEMTSAQVLGLEEEVDDHRKQEL
jgi:hypothetical protein